MKEFDKEFDLYLNEGIKDKRFDQIRRANKLYVQAVQSTSSYWDWINSIHKKEK